MTKIFDNVPHLEDISSHNFRESNFNISLKNEDKTRHVSTILNN
jgi:hypothetical protein